MTQKRMQDGPARQRERVMVYYEGCIAFAMAMGWITADQAGHTREKLSGYSLAEVEGLARRIDDAEFALEHMPLGPRKD